MSWANRVRHPMATPPLQQVQAAAHNIAEQVGVPPGKARMVFQTVTDVVLLSTVLLSGALAAVHLYKALFPRHKDKEDHSTPEPQGSDRPPPHRRRLNATAAAADDHGGYEEAGYHSR